VSTCELLAAGLEAAKPSRELGDATGAVALGHRPGLEGGEVAIERVVGPSSLRLDSPELGLAAGALGVELGERVGDRLAHHVLLGEDALELAEDRLLEL